MRGGYKTHLRALAHIVKVTADADSGVLCAAHHNGLAVGVLTGGVVAHAKRQFVDAGLCIGVGQVARCLVVDGAVALHVPCVLCLCRCSFCLVEDDDLLALTDGVAAKQREHRCGCIAVGLDVGGTPCLAGAGTYGEGVKTVARGYGYVADVHHCHLARREGYWCGLAVTGVCVPVVLGIVGAAAHKHFVEVGGAPHSVTRAGTQCQTVNASGESSCGNL